MSATRDLDPSASVLAYFGAELRRRRQAAGYSQEQLARAIIYSPSLVGAVETATRMPSRDFARRCDDVLDADETFDRLWPLVSRETYPTWFQQFAELEREATSLRTFMPLAIPGLLQTEDYARALFRAGRPWDTAAQVEELVDARIGRQAILVSDDPPMLRVVIDESALRRPIGSANGGSAVMAGQLEILADAATRPRVVIQVVPLSTGEHVGLVGGFTIAGFAGALMLPISTR